MHDSARSRTTLANALQLAAQRAPTLIRMQLPSWDQLTSCSLLARLQLACKQAADPPEVSTSRQSADTACARLTAACWHSTMKATKMMNLEARGCGSRVGVERVGRDS